MKAYRKSAVGWMSLISSGRSNALVCAGVLLLSLFFFAISAQAQITLAGSVILNQAELSYLDDQGQTHKVVSNISKVSVGAIARLELIGDNQRFVAAAQTVSFPHQLINNGNSPDSYQLSVVDLTGDSGDFGDITIYRDINGNGQADPGEPEFSETPVVNPGDTLFLVAEASVPSSASEGDRYQLTITVVSVIDPTQSDQNTDTAILTADTLIRINKTSSQLCDLPLFVGEEIHYTLNFTNTGNSQPPERNIQVNGAVASGVLLEDKLPYGVSLIFGQVITLAPHQALPVIRLYEDSGSASWISYDQWDGVKPVASVGLVIPSGNIVPNQSGMLSFSVLVNEGVTENTLLTNTARIDLDGDGADEFVSNSVCNKVSGSQATIRFMATAPDFLKQGLGPEFGVDESYVDADNYLLNIGAFDYTSSLDGVYIELNSSSVSDQTFVTLDDGRRQVEVEVSSTLVGDKLTVVLQEIRIGSAIYRSLSPIELNFEHGGDGGICSSPGGSGPNFIDVTSSCVLHSKPNDELHVSFFDSGVNRLLEDTATVDPLGTVFDSDTLQPITGAVVTIFNANGSRAIDPVSGEAIEAFITSDDGKYSFPRLTPGSYYLAVEPPQGYAFSSVVPASSFTRFVVSDPSYGIDGFSGVAGSGIFTIQTGEQAPQIDIPLDPTPLTGAVLLLEKTVGQKYVELGDLVSYQLQVVNKSEFAVSGVVVEDTLPYGFKYVPGSVRIDSEPAAEPKGGVGPVLQFEMGELDANQQANISYLLEVTAGAVDGDGVNIAVARVNSPQLGESLPARAKVRLRRSGVLSERAFLFGKVFVDTDCDDIQAEGEWPIGGVKLVLQDGTWAITDENGQYTLYGLRPGQYVVKVDPLTLPEGIKLKPIDNRHAADADSRFVDLVAGEIHRADFAASCPAANQQGWVFEQLRERNASITGDWMLQDAERFDPNRKKTQNDLQRARGTDGDLSHGLINSSATSIRGELEKLPTGATVPVQVEDATIVTDQPESRMPVSEDVVKTITQEQGRKGTWLWPQSKISDDGRFMVAVRSGITPSLYVNGEPVANTQLGEQIVNKAAQAQVMAWYGVHLNEGQNSLQVKAIDSFGNERVMAEGSFVRPLDATQLSMEPADTKLAADGGRSTLAIKLRMLDKNGYPARGRYFVTIEASDGLWLEPDIQDREPGQQIVLEEGETTIHLRSSEYTGAVTLRASSSELQTEEEIHFVPALRPLLATGFVQLGYSNGGIKGDGNDPTRQLEEFEGGDIETRATVYMKGKIAGDYHLTLSYDTDKDTDEDLLRDIDPNQYYPIYGDNSVRGYDAQSRSKLHAKIEKEKNSLMWGDFVTDARSDHEDIARVQRPFTGAKAIYDDDKTRLELFAAEQGDLRRVEEIPGEGLALNYRLSGAPVVKNSEVVELITHDRDNTGLIISSEKLNRFTDYTLDHLSGQFRFSRAIPSIDEDRNPVFIRITYDVAGDGDDYLVAGARIAHHLTEQLTVGGSYTKDKHEREGYDLAGGFIEYQVGDKTKISLAGATMRHGNGDERGDGYRINLEHSWNNGSKTQATWGRAEQGFTNTGSGISPDREELRATHQHRLTDTINANLEAISSKSLSTDEERRALGITLDTQVQGINIKGGSRIISQDNAGGGDTFTTFIAEADQSLNLFGREIKLGTEYEQALGQSDKKRFSLNGDIQVHEKIGLYGRYELINSLGGISGLSSTQKNSSFVAGFKSELLPSTQSFSEYRVRGTEAGRDLEAVSGIQGSYEIMEGLTIDPRFEVINALEGRGNDSTAFSVGAKYTANKNSRYLTRFEARRSDISDYYGFTGSYIRRINHNWSGFAREDLRYETPKQGDNKIDHTLTLGLTRRPRRFNKYHLLTMYQWREVDGHSDTDRTAHLFSTHHNYQYSDTLVLSGRVGAKVATVTSADGQDFNSNVALIDGRLLWDFTRRFDLDIHGGVLATNGTDDLRYSAGIGINALVRRNLRLGMGYNFAGFTEKDLDGEGFNARGFYINMQYKFDEDLFGWLTGESDD